jgi:hypothetical protein
MQSDEATVLVKMSSPFLSYEAKLEEGKNLEITNEGGQTIVSLSGRRNTSQRRNRGMGITTGRWSKKPVVFRVGKDIIVWAETTTGRRFLRMDENRVEMLDGEPALMGATEIRLTKSSDVKPME